MSNLYPSPDLITSWLSGEHFFLDFEASGLLGDSYPIEIGVYGCDGSRLDTLIKPVHYWTYWSHDAQDIHGIIRERLDDGMSAVDVAGQLNERYQAKTLWADSNMDSFWMSVLFEAADLDMQFKVGNLHHLLTEEQSTEFIKHIKRPVAHRAFQDAFDIRTAWFDYLKAAPMTETQA